MVFFSLCSFQVPADYKNVIRPLFDKVRPCVVSIEAYAKAVIKEETLPSADEHKDVTNVKKEENKRKAAGTGFVVHCSNNFTVVTVHTSFKFQGQNAVVKFWDGTEATDTRVIKLNGPMNLIVANIPHGDWKAVRYDQIKEDGYSQIVLSIFSLMYWRLPCVCRIMYVQTTLCFLICYYTFIFRNSVSCCICVAVRQDALLSLPMATRSLEASRPSASTFQWQENNGKTNMKFMISSFVT